MIIMGDFPFPKQKWRRRGLGKRGGDRRRRRRDWEERKEEKLWPG